MARRANRRNGALIHVAGSWIGPGILGLAVLTLLTGPIQAASDRDVDDCERGSPAAAIPACTRIFEESRDGEVNRSASLAARGLAYFKLGDYDRAIADYSEAIRYDPGYSRAFVRRANAHLAKRDVDAALADADTGIRLNPYNMEAYLIRGAIFHARGDLDRAIVEYSQSIEKFPLNPGALNRRGMAYRAKRDFPAALADFSAAMDLNKALDKEAPSAFLNRGDTYRESGDSEKAIADYRKALELKPDLEPAREQLRALGATP